MEIYYKNPKSGETGIRFSYFNEIIRIVRKHLCEESAKKKGVEKARAKAKEKNQAIHSSN